jgi:ribonuclease T2
MGQTLPTFTWLANAGITPSTTQTHTLAQLTSALKAQSVSIPLDFLNKNPS